MRYLYPFIKKDLQTKMVFISGPRQCGKTHLSQALLQVEKNGEYFNWDDPDQRKQILKRDWKDDSRLIILDEIHKYAKWKNFLKGTFDVQKEKHTFLVTGSARLDIYKKGQDSMLGRYFSWRLHPFCLAELKEADVKINFEKLMIHGGFPEPFLMGDETFSRRWRKERVDLIFREDVRDLERVREISLISLLRDELTARCGQLIEYANLAGDLEVAPKTVKNWLQALERCYVLFTVTPYSKNLARALIKPPKVYFYDNGEVSGDKGHRFENLVANHLFKRLHFLTDSTGHDYRLHYIRDKDKHEVDFVILKNRNPVALIEVKYSDEVSSPSLHYYGDKLKIKNRIQIVAECKGKKTRNGVSIVPVSWLAQPLGDEGFYETGVD